jgi:hypothetical protein
LWFIETPPLKTSLHLSKEEEKIGVESKFAVDERRRRRRKRKIKVSL